MVYLTWSPDMIVVCQGFERNIVYYHFSQVHHHGRTFMYSLGKTGRSLAILEQFPLGGPVRACWSISHRPILGYTGTISSGWSRSYMLEYITQADPWLYWNNFLWVVPFVHAGVYHTGCSLVILEQFPLCGPVRTCWSISHRPLLGYTGTISSGWSRSYMLEYITQAAPWLYWNNFLCVVPFVHAGVYHTGRSLVILEQFPLGGPVRTCWSISHRPLLGYTGTISSVWSRSYMLEYITQAAPWLYWNNFLWVVPFVHAGVYHTGRSLVILEPFPLCGPVRACWSISHRPLLGYTGTISSVWSRLCMLEYITQATPWLHWNHFLCVVPFVHAGVYHTGCSLVILEQFPLCGPVRTCWSISHRPLLGYTGTISCGWSRSYMLEYITQAAPWLYWNHFLCVVPFVHAGVYHTGHSLVTLEPFPLCGPVCACWSISHRPLLGYTGTISSVWSRSCMLEYITQAAPWLYWNHFLCVVPFVHAGVYHTGHSLVTLEPFPLCGPVCACWSISHRPLLGYTGTISSVWSRSCMLEYITQAAPWLHWNHFLCVVPFVHAGVYHTGCSLVILEPFPLCGPVRTCWCISHTPRILVRCRCFSLHMYICLTLSLRVTTKCCR